MIFMPFDTETTGIPEWKIPSDDPSQPHLVSLAALAANEETRETSNELSLLIKPDGWSWDDSENSEDGAFQTHKITMAQALDEGVPEKEAVDMLLDLHRTTSLRVAFNTTFDNRLIRIAIKRYYGNDEAEIWKNSPYSCAMINSRKIMGGSNPTLASAYEFFTGKPMEDAHNAKADMMACLEVYWGILDHLAQHP